ncbi:hypothetical protein QBE53_01715 [Vallitaleaceae bacterium 9-2]
MNRKVGKELLVYIIIFLLSILILIYGAKNNNTITGTVAINVGTSILASVFIYFILNFFIGDPLKPIVSSMKEIKMGLTDTITLLGQASKTGLVGIWSNRSDLETKYWIEILKESKGDIDILCYAMAFLPEHSDFNSLISEKINLGYSVRILLGNPCGNNIKSRTIEEKNEGSISSRIETSRQRLKQIQNFDKIQIKYHDTPLYASIYRFGDTILVTPQLYGTRGAKAPLLKVQKNDTDSSLYESYSTYFKLVWDNAISENNIQNYNKSEK